MSSLSNVRRQSIDLDGKALDGLSESVISTISLKKKHSNTGRSIAAPGYENCTFIILGRPGQGKSTISNMLGGYDADDGPFSVSASTASCTKNVERLGCIIDTPGMPDTNDSSVMSLVYADALLKVCKKAGVKNVNLYIFKPDRIEQSVGKPATFGVEFDLEFIDFMSQPLNYHQKLRNESNPFSDQMIVVLNFENSMSHSAFNDYVESLLQYCRKYREDMYESLAILHYEGWITHTSIDEGNGVLVSKIENMIDVHLLGVKNKGFPGTFSGKATSSSRQIRAIIKKYPVMSKAIGIHHLK
jgi:hypothetical protein